MSNDVANINDSRKKLKMSTMALYGFGTMGEIMAYTLYYAFFIFFLTGVVGISPAAAGTISLVAVIWDAITDPLVGQISDNTKSKYGKRLPFMVIFSIPLGISLYLMFYVPNFSNWNLIFYYFIINVLFWLFFTLTDIPYIALGSEITTDYVERTWIRIFAQGFNIIGGAVILSGTMIFVDMFTELLGTEIKGWAATGLFYAVSVTASFLICAFFLRGKEPIDNNEGEKISIKKSIPEMVGLLKIRQYRIVLAIALIGNIILGIGESTQMFIQINIYDLTYGQIGVVNLIASAAGLVAIIIIGMYSEKLDKKYLIMFSMIGVIAGNLWLWLMPHVYMNAIIGLSLVTSGYCIFWAMIFSLNYDIVEIDEFINGSRREGIVVSFNSFMMKIGIALGMWLVGISLSLFSFDATLLENSAKAMFGLSLTSMGLPIIFSILGLIPILSYKVSSSKFNALTEAITQRKKGNEYLTKDFSDII